MEIKGSKRTHQKLVKATKGPGKQGLGIFGIKDQGYVKGHLG